jgi:amidohydrolase
MGSDLKEEAWAVIRQHEAALRELAVRIHQHPEVGYAEEKAAGWLGDMLLEHGFQVERGLADLPTAFRGCHGIAGPQVALLAEYDALPGVGHGCGHNLIGPAAVGAALGVAGVLDRTGGRVCVIGTPAEEYSGRIEGKVRLLEAGVFADVDVALMMHPQYEFRLPGADLGFIACELTFRGRPAHAAADPWNGANALDGLLLTFNNINALRQHLRPQVRVHGIVTEGGQAPNMVPERASASLMVRAGDPGSLEAVYERVANCARAGALASGTRVEIERITTVLNLRVNETLSELIAANLAQLGRPVNPTPLDTSGSSDFGSVSHALPSGMFWAATHRPGTPWHAPETAAGAVEERALEAMMISACALAGVAIDLLADRAHLTQVQSEWEREEQRAP